MRLVDADKLRTIRSIQSGDFNSIETIQKWIDDAPTITLKEYAKAEGYSIIKKKPMPKLRPCPRCGASGRKIEEWVCRTGYFYICSECNHQSNPARSERKARENWNDSI